MISIVHSAQDTTLETNHNGSLLAPGALVSDGTKNDSIPATGAGAWLMRCPAKAAFRVGWVRGQFSKGNVWDTDSVGIYSVSVGHRPGPLTWSYSTGASAPAT